MACGIRRDGRIELGATALRGARPARETVSRQWAAGVCVRAPRPRIRGGVRGWARRFWRVYPDFRDGFSRKSAQTPQKHRLQFSPVLGEFPFNAKFASLVWFFPAVEHCRACGLLIALRQENSFAEIRQHQHRPPHVNLRFLDPNPSARPAWKVPSNRKGGVAVGRLLTAPPPRAAPEIPLK
jgi:hypothetical protein